MSNPADTERTRGTIAESLKEVDPNNVISRQDHDEDHLTTSDWGSTSDEEKKKKLLEKSKLTPQQ